MWGMLMQTTREDTPAPDEAAQGEQRGQPGEAAGHPKEYEESLRDPGMAHTARAAQSQPCSAHPFLEPSSLSPNIASFHCPRIAISMQDLACVPRVW